MDKAAMRQGAHVRRGALVDAARERAAQAHLRAALADWGGAALAGYLPIRSEIDPRPVMAEHRGAVGVPVIRAGDRPLDFHLWQPGAPLVAGPFGVQVPQEAAPMVPRVVIVPLLAFDARGYRLGYGGGFYDRTLAALRARGPVWALGFAYGGQELPRVPVESTDQPLDAVVTETGLVRFR